MIDSSIITPRNIEGVPYLRFCQLYRLFDPIPSSVTRKHIIALDKLYAHTNPDWRIMCRLSKEVDHTIPFYPPESVKLIGHSIGSMTVAEGYYGQLPPKDQWTEHKGSKR